MSRLVGLAVVVAALLLGASITSIAQAQTIGMAGEYSENNGHIVHIPQNPPNVPCTHTSNDARCIRNARIVNRGPQEVVSQYPHHGVYGARIVPPAGSGPGLAGRPQGLNVGDPFVVPPLLMQQRLGQQVGIVLNNTVVQIDTTYTAAAPNHQRLKNPPANTRRFSAMNWSLGGGQNNGLTGMAEAARLAADTTITRDVGPQTLTMRYKAGPNQFGGTMATLLDGGGRLYLSGPLLQQGFPPDLQPAAGTNPVGDTTSGPATKNGAGWNYTARGRQGGGRIKSYGPGEGVPASIAEAVVGPDCGPTPPPSPEGCNRINGFDTYGVVVADLVSATSTRHMFAWTTGTVSIVDTLDCQTCPLLATRTLTGMGYDTVTTDGTVQNRNIGLVAGSYTIRTDSLGTVQINRQIIGVDFKLTPEPSATLALVSGLALLGALAARRRETAPSQDRPA